MLIKTPTAGQRKLFAELPFASDASGITGAFEQISESSRLGFHVTEFNVVADVVLRRHQLHACGRAKRLDVTILETHAGLCQAIEVRCRILPTIGADAFE